jgi:predicted small lipoprotein YifL
LRGNDGWKKVLAVVLVALAVAGCGKKGQPSPPPGVPNTYPQNYPAQ